MKCEKCGIEFHEDHGCGTAVMCGSSYAEHCMRCRGVPIMRKIDGSPVYLNDTVPNVFEPVNSEYLPWEAPAGECPVCWHKGRPEVELKVNDFWKNKLGSR